MPFQEKIGLMSVTSGIKKKTAGKIPTCRICKKQIMPNTKTVTIHKIGEYPSEFHDFCASKLMEIISRKSRVGCAHQKIKRGLQPTRRGYNAKKAPRFKN